MGHALPHYRATGGEADQWRTTTSAYLRGRARQYRLAAAVADCPRDVSVFCDLAMMFDQLAHDFKRLEKEKRQRQPAATLHIVTHLARALPG